MGLYNKCRSIVAISHRCSSTRRPIKRSLTHARSAVSVDSRGTPPALRLALVEIYPSWVDLYKSRNIWKCPIKSCVLSRRYLSPGARRIPVSWYFATVDLRRAAWFQSVSPTHRPGIALASRRRSWESVLNTCQSFSRECGHERTRFARRAVSVLGLGG
jgi:hypothetical protein